MSTGIRKKGKSAEDGTGMSYERLGPLTLLAAWGTWLVRKTAGLLAVLLILYSGYVLWDTFYTGQSAFSSWDLLQYKPGNVGEEPGFKELQEINPQVCAWLTLDGTNIDYPVLQGEDDMDYVNKDVYGNASLTGAIFLTTLNEADFSDAYNLIYGHHMENGAMFGDIDRFADQVFLESHRSGNLITPEAVYDLNVFACVETDAYESMIYDVQGKNRGEKEEAFSEVLAYGKEHAYAWADTSASELSKLLVLSTCAEANTNGRTVLFADMMLRTEPLPARETPQKAAPPVKGHGQNEKWALLNLVCVVLCFLNIRQWEQISVRRKYLLLVGRGRTQAQAGQPGETVRDLQNNGRKRERLSARAKIGILLELFLAIGALVIFLLTEDIRIPITVVDGYTPIMIAIYGAAILVEHTVLRADIVNNKA